MIEESETTDWVSPYIPPKLLVRHSRMLSLSGYYSAHRKLVDALKGTNNFVPIHAIKIVSKGTWSLLTSVEKSYFYVLGHQLTFCNHCSMFPCWYILSFTSRLINYLTRSSPVCSASSFTQHNDINLIRSSSFVLTPMDIQPLARIVVSFYSLVIRSIGLCLGVYLSFRVCVYYPTYRSI